MAIYVHVPFCRTRCLYCGCNTQTVRNADRVQVYLDHMMLEVRRLGESLTQLPPVRVLSMGGGTPTLLEKKQMHDLVQQLRACMPLAESAEMAIEVDPRSVDANDLNHLVDLGFNRFSFGIQDLDPAVQQAVHRVIPFEKVAERMAALKGRGDLPVNVDLIYGLPCQTETSFGRTLEQIIDLSPSRLALFGYAHVPWMCPHQKALEKFELPDERLRWRLLGLAFDRLIEAGYVPVGMDHFARPDDELVHALNQGRLSRNFMGYTPHRGLDIVAMGASAISAVGHTYAQNTRSSDDYTQAMDRGMAWERARFLTEEDVLRREIILDLFCNGVLDIGGIETRFEVDFHRHFESELERMDAMAGDDLVQVTRHEVQVTGLGRHFIRNLCMVFDAYLEDRDVPQRYSRTV